MPDALMPGAPARTFRSALVAWCQGCKYWLPEDEIGNHCFAAPDCTRTLVKRRMLICEAENPELMRSKLGVPQESLKHWRYSCAMAFRTQEEADNHECYSAC